MFGFAKKQESTFVLPRSQRVMVEVAGDRCDVLSFSTVPDLGGIFNGFERTLPWEPTAEELGLAVLEAMGHSEVLAAAPEPRPVHAARRSFRSEKAYLKGLKSVYADRLTHRPNAVEVVVTKNNGRWIEFTETVIDTSDDPAELGAAVLRAIALST